MLVFKLLKYLFPFIKEMVLGDKTIRQSLLTNKLRVLLVGLILFSIFLNFLLVPKLFQISWEHVELQKRYKEAVPLVVDKPLPKPKPPTPVAPVVTPTPPAEGDLDAAFVPLDETIPSAVPLDDFERTRAFFERIRKREAQARS